MYVHTKDHQTGGQDQGSLGIDVKMLRSGSHLPLKSSYDLGWSVVVLWS